MKERLRYCMQCRVQAAVLYSLACRAHELSSVSAGALSAQCTTERCSAAECLAVHTAAMLNSQPMTRLTAKSAFSDLSRNVGCFLHKS